ncbi:chitobiase/beta-hexosaminidase C-terminal domain-containing protein [Chromobacterium haemolyticum]|nr:chitobiase/beta-hexosaminidase C-terminal domain-containing protein [Chromobacterium haemolyticum]
MAYPRLLALAERAWHRAGWERPYRQGERYQQLGVSHLVDRTALNRDWQQFAAVLGWREAAKLEGAGIGLRIAPPGLESGSAGVLTEFPGQALQFSPDGRNWAPYRPGQGAEASYWRGVSGDGARFSRQESRGGD